MWWRKGRGGGSEPWRSIKGVQCADVSGELGAATSTARGICSPWAPTRQMRYG